tara:strand:- start:5 stop:1561 length:1557 start_codon:yes stop_codon:yes gene_type:complete
MSVNPAPQQAVIYCRVSGAKQVREGDGLASQETRCREYAKYKGYTVLDVFTDDVSGKATSRVGMQSMLGYLHMNASKAKEIVVIIDDISRLARGLTAHLELRTSLSKAGGKPESPSIEFGEDSDSILVENLLASVAQHQREKNGEQTSNRMKGRMMNGYSVFMAPLGYKYEKRSGHGKILVRDEPNASIVVEAMEGYASGRFASMAEVRTFLQGQPDLPKANGYVRQQVVSVLFNRVLYAGYIEHEPWGITRRKGHHKALITLETFQRIQVRKASRMVAPARRDINQDFPLRGAVCCAECDVPMTACWSTGGMGKRYPYFWCQTKTCEMYRKNIRAEKIEAAFEGLMYSLTPSKGLIGVVKAMLTDAWSQRLKQADAIKDSIKRDITGLDSQLDGLLNRIVETNNETVVAAYEKKITKLEQDKLLLADKLDQNVQPKHTLEEIFELSMAFLSNPWNIWKSGELALKKTVLRTVFQSPLAYSKDQGFRTPQTSVIFGFLDEITEKCKMVPPHGLEPRTY